MNDLLFDNKHVDALIFSFAICYGFLRLLTGLPVHTKFNIQNIYCSRPRPI